MLLDLKKTLISIRDFNDFKKFLYRHIIKIGGELCEEIHRKDDDHYTQAFYKGIRLGNIINIADSEYSCKTHNYMVVDFTIEGKIGLFPIESLYSCSMNSDPITKGGYEYSTVKNSNMNEIMNRYKRIFRHYLHSCDLANEFQIFGKQYFQILTAKDYFDSNINKEYAQLPLFKHISLSELIDKGIFHGEHFWLSGIASTKEFCMASSQGTPGKAVANCSNAIYPLLYIGYPKC